MDKYTNRWFYTSINEDDASIDLSEYADELQGVYEELDEFGYDVIQVVPIQMPISLGSFKETGTFTPAEYIGEVGFSVTRGAVVIGKKRDV